LRKIRSRTVLFDLVPARSFGSRRQNEPADHASAEFGMWIASMRTMTDENYVSLLLWTICVLMFACGVVAITEHPNWFGA
jgi:hypothetical protein